MTPSLLLRVGWLVAVAVLPALAVEASGPVRPFTLTAGIDLSTGEFDPPIDTTLTAYGVFGLTSSALDRGVGLIAGVRF